MNKEMYDLADWSIKAAQSAGADLSRVGINKERFVEISYRERKPENIKEASSRNLNIEIFVNGRYSSQSTSDLRIEALKEFIYNSVKVTKLLAEDPYRSLPDPKYYEGRAKKDLKIIDESYDKLTPEKRHSLVKTIEDSCLSEGGEKTISVTATEYDSHGESVLLSSNGFSGYRESTVFWAGASMTAKDDGDRRPAGYNYVGAVTKESIPAAEEIGKTAARRTLDLLGAKKIKTETLPIIVENRNAPQLIWGLLSAMFGRNIQQKQSFLADKKGLKIASEYLTVIDDPLMIGGMDSRLYDGDGFATHKRTMIDSGVLKEFYLDWYYSRKLGWDPTTGSSSNIIIPPGKRSVNDILKDLGKCILVTGFIGGNSNSTTGDSSIGIFGQLFENGEPVQAVAEMNIADNHLKFWHKLAEVANDPWIYSSQQTPSLVFTDVVVSGV